MNSKYADLPDIDTAPDIYETEDALPASQNTKGESSDEEPSSRQNVRNGRQGNGASREELDTGSLMRANEASRQFNRAEKRQRRSRLLYAYPSSSSSSRSSSPEGRPAQTQKPIPLPQRLRALQTELTALEHELADPSNSLLHKEREESVDPGELIKGLVDVRGRLDKIRKDKEGRGKLLNAIIGDPSSHVNETTVDAHPGKQTITDEKSTIRTIIEMDRRVGDLETVIGSSNFALDEMTPMPHPLLPFMTRLNNQLMVLTQPRHVDSISRRLKLLLSDLDRLSVSQHHRRQTSQTPTNPSTIQDQLCPILSRLNPFLSQIPHILTRLRTLSALHGAASEFQGTLAGLEAEGARTRDSLQELQHALDQVEASISENRDVVKDNVTGLEKRIDELMRRLDSVTQ
ncbi:hypothetical protein M378DRAFT_158085 [Amanita muscaria Koide BX008]|uniref:Dynamitin n=1 Tax=Amanita muscaria (strain Koide BX008) TaxID=946122 RepID=A0A0C2TP08_AMAMK|nr:hypothetical protein M378DRAFT_158085 [Amanita muscaria Koide BX008]